MNLLDTLVRNLTNSTMHRIEPGLRAHASVAILLKQGRSGLEVLLIERATHENDLWSGHIGLPGGKVDPEDSDPRQTAERETMEEVGVNLTTARYLGRLRDIVPGGLPIVVSCYAYALSEAPELRPDAAEVADAFWFPLKEAYAPERQTSVAFTRRGQTRHFPAIRVHDAKEQPLWGITYRLLKNLKLVADVDNLC